jgi:N6-adenosine-specific RNA methylase IME4
LTCSRGQRARCRRKPSKCLLPRARNICRKSCGATKNSKVRVGTGYRVPSCHEVVLLAAFAGRHHHKEFSSLFDGLAREHSRKPDEFYRLVADRTSGMDRCDLFSWETRSGFDGWGNEHGKFDRVS